MGPEVALPVPREAAGMCLPPPPLRRYARVLGLARHEAMSLGAPALGTEHLLLGLVREGRESGDRLLSGVDPDGLRALLPRARRSLAAPPALTTRAAMAVGAAQREADRRGLSELEVEGLLVAVLADQQSAAVAVLERLGIDVADLWTRAVVALRHDPVPPVRLRRRGRVCVREVGVSGSRGACPTCENGCSGPLTCMITV